MLGDLLDARDIEQESQGKISRQRAYELARLGLLPHTRLGRRVFFSKNIVQDFLEAGGKAFPGGWKRG